MNKKRKYIIILLSIFVVIIAGIIIAYQIFIEGSNSGTIHLTVNGEKVNLSDIPIDMEGENVTGAPWATAAIQYNQFHFAGGLYGYNSFRFVIPKNLLAGYDSDLEVTFETFNANEWHDAIHELHIDITADESGNCLTNIIYKKTLPITDRGGLLWNDTKTASTNEIIYKNNSKISIYL